MEKLPKYITYFTVFFEFHVIWKNYKKVYSLLFSDTLSSRDISEQVCFVSTKVMYRHMVYRDIERSIETSMS